MFRYQIRAALTLAMVTASSAAAASHGSPCPTYKTVKKTIYVPQVTYVDKTIHVTCYRPEVRERKVTVPRHIYETKHVEQTCTVMQPKHTTRTVRYTTSRPIYKDVEITQTVMVPKHVKRTCMRTVCRPYQDEVTHTICEDHGHWETRTVPAPHRGCGCHQCCKPVTCKVWVPKIVKREVTRPVTRYRYEQVPYEYTDVCYEPEQRKRMVRRCVDVEYRQHTREVPCVTYEPKVVTRKVPMVSYRCEYREVVQKCTVMVPYQQEKVIQVPVCKMVPKTIRCQVPTAAGCWSYCSRFARRCGIF